MATHTPAPYWLDLPLGELSTWIAIVNEELASQRPR